jgi:small-conductance mechanosensitive channel
VVKIINEIGWPFYVLLSFCLALHLISLPPGVQIVLKYILIILLTGYAVWFIQKIIDFASAKLAAKKKEKEKRGAPIIELLAKILKITIWMVAILLVLANLGYNISTLLAGLGIGGIAIAFGLQAILNDIFASFSIYFDKPFEEGDFIVVGDDKGVVKKIGIKSTRIQSLWGEEIIISNKELTGTRIHNYKKMKERRIHFTFGVVYETPTEKLKKIPGIVKKIFDGIESVNLDRIHFKKFGDFSLDHEVAYYVNTADYNKYMDIQQKINLTLKEEFEKEGIEFAYPTQTIFLNRQESKS